MNPTSPENTFTPNDNNFAPLEASNDKLPIAPPCPDLANKTMMQLRRRVKDNHNIKHKNSWQISQLQAQVTIVKNSLTDKQKEMDDLKAIHVADTKETVTVFENKINEMSQRLEEVTIRYENQIKAKEQLHKQGLKKKNSELQELSSKFIVGRKSANDVSLHVQISCLLTCELGSPDRQFPSQYFRLFRRRTTRSI